MSTYTSSVTLPSAKPLLGWDVQPKSAVTAPSLNSSISGTSASVGITAISPDIKTGTSFDFNAGLSAAGTLASVVGGVMANRSNEKYRKGILDREDERIDRARARQDKFDADMSKSYS